MFSDAPRYTSSAETTTENGTPRVSKCFCPKRTLSASLVRSLSKSLVLYDSMDLISPGFVGEGDMIQLGSAESPLRKELIH